jgi:rubrerythrin
MTTTKNLLAAIAAESKAHIRYVASQLIAEREGWPQAAKLFKALAEAEVIHAVNHLNVLGEMAGTDINIESAIAFENFEYSTMYPEFIEQAEKDGENLALLSFRGAMAGEGTHSDLLNELKNQKNDNIDSPYFICPKCGNIENGEAPPECPVCGLFGEGYKPIV